jgi:hypothetical protein
VISRDHSEASTEELAGAMIEGAAMTDICGRERNSLDHSQSVLIEAGVIRKKITDHKPT